MKTLLLISILALSLPVYASKFRKVSCLDGNGKSLDSGTFITDSDNLDLVDAGRATKTVFTGRKVNKSVTAIAPRGPRAEEAIRAFIGNEKPYEAWMINCSMMVKIKYENLQPMTLTCDTSAIQDFETLDAAVLSAYRNGCAFITRK